MFSGRNKVPSKIMEVNKTKLNGVLIIDLVSEMQRVRVNQEIKKIKKHSEAKLKQQSITKRFVL